MQNMHASLQIRPAAVAGSFYPGSATELSRTVDAMLAAAPGAQTTPIKALIVPHAGYVYSGAVAASAYALLAAQRDSIRRVVLLGPCHRVATRGLALPAARAFATPLGKIAIDAELAATLLDLPQVQQDDAAHQFEHSLEVQLPFLQTVLGNFTLLPLAVGDATDEEVAAVLDRLWGGPETLIVISSDLSHYHAYDEAQRRDRATVAQILALQPLTSFEQACGALPVNGLIACARRHGLAPRLVEAKNSGDGVGDRARVVGYASLAFSPLPASGERRELGLALLAQARAAIAAELGLASAMPPPLAVMNEPAAAFVTLTKSGQLRGCIGSLEARRSMLEDVRGNACAAAFRDPRFAPLVAAELPQLRVEVSLLSPPVEMAVSSEEDALRQLRPGIDGLIFRVGDRRSTFLPQVWESLPEPRQFLAQLKQKAGVASDYWSPEVRLWRYQAEKFKEPP